MKNENELDDFLRQKEEEFNIPFEEKYWDKAAAFIDAERGRKVVGFGVKNIMLVAAVVLMLVGGLYFAFTTNSSHKTEIANSTTVSSNGNSMGTSANNSTTNNTVTNNSTTTNKTNNTVTDNTSTNTNSNASVAGNTSATSNSGKAKASGNNNTGTIVTGSDLPPYKYGSFNGTATNATARKEKHSASNKDVTSVNNSISNSTTTTKSRENVNSQNVNVVTNETVTLSSANRVEDKLNTVDTKPQPYLNSPDESLIPVFENMNVYDKTMARLYGLPLSSQANHVYKKVQSIDQRFPLLEVSATGGLNIFKAFDENVKNHSYLATNPFIGAKATYRWNEKNWFAQAQLNILQQGGVNQNVSAAYLNEGVLNSSSEVMRVRNMYYVQLPVMMGYQIVSGNNKVSTIAGGLGVSYLLGDGVQVKDTASGKYIGSYKLEQNKGLRHMDCFIALGYCYKLNRKISFSVTAQYGLIDVTKDGYFAESNNDHNMNIGLGVNYSILKKRITTR